MGVGGHAGGACEMSAVAARIEPFKDRKGDRNGSRDNGLDESWGAEYRGNTVTRPSFAHRRGLTQIQEVLNGDTTGPDRRASRSLLAAPSGAREQ